MHYIGPMKDVHGSHTYTHTQLHTYTHALKHTVTHKHTHTRASMFIHYTSHIRLYILVHSILCEYNCTCISFCVHNGIMGLVCRS